MMMMMMCKVTSYRHQVKKSEGEPFDFISKFNLPVVNALWNVTAGHRFEYNDPKLISMIQVDI